MADALPPIVAGVPTPRAPAPAPVEPVSLELAKLALLYDPADQDALISLLITSGREQAETFTDQVFATRAAGPWALPLTAARGPFRLPAVPVASVDAVTVDPGDGTPAVPVTDYTVVGVAAGWNVPAVLTVAAAVVQAGPPGAILRVAYTVGPGTDLTVPAPVCQAILELVRDGFVRETAPGGQYPGQALQLPARVVALLFPYRIERSALVDAWGRPRSGALWGAECCCPW